jgi:uncharacterized membrane protein (TIGR02234 family)
VRREPLLAALLCVAGSFLVLVGTGRAWVLVTAGGGALLPAREVGVTGADLSPGLQALGLVGLAGVLALAASRGRGRTVVGLLVLAVGAGVLAVVVVLQLAGAGLGGRALVTDRVREAGGAQGEAFDLTAWPLVTGLGGLLLLLAGLLVAARGRRWAALGRRYEAPAARQPEPQAPERELWEALDRGEDPTGAQDPPDGGAGGRG